MKNRTTIFSFGYNAEEKLLILKKLPENTQLIGVRFQLGDFYISTIALTGCILVITTIAIQVILNYL